jgi:hypothetical protein
MARPLLTEVVLVADSALYSFDHYNLQIQDSIVHFVTQLAKCRIFGCQVSPVQMSRFQVRMLDTISFH